jgi:hypothetical protein
MVMFGIRISSLAASSFLCALAVSAADPFVGTWVLNAEESRIRSGLRMTIERWGQAFRYSSGGVEFTALLDGAEYPLRGITSKATVSLKRVDERTVERTYSRDGMPVTCATLTVSPDGRFLKVSIRRVDQDGQGPQWVNTYQKAAGSEGKDPFAGTWDRNPIRLIGNSPSGIAFEAHGENGLRFTSDQVEYSAKPDGKEYPVRGTIVANSVALKRIDTRTLEEDWKDNGKVAANVLRAVTADGVELRVTVRGTTPQGDPFENLFVYRKK